MRRRALHALAVGVAAPRWGDEQAAELLPVPSRPGISKLKIAHSSPRWFSIGVPVRQRRMRLLRLQRLQKGDGLARFSNRLVEHHHVPRNAGQRLRRVAAAGSWSAPDRGAEGAAAFLHGCRDGDAPFSVGAAFGQALPVAEHDVGAMIIGPGAAPLAMQRCKCAKVCTVLRPMSSASTPPMPELCRGVCKPP